VLADSGAYTIMQSLIAAGSGILGVCVGGYFTARQQRQERRNTRIREQLQGFYSPMLGMRHEIEAKSEVRGRLSGLAQTAYPQLYEGVKDPASKLRIQEENLPDFVKLSNYNNAQFRDEIVPLYKKMLEHFSAHMWLAEPSTQALYGALCDFVEIWQRTIEGTIPAEVAFDLNHSEEPLRPFYKDLRHHFDRLTAELSK